MRDQETIGGSFILIRLLVAGVFIPEEIKKFLFQAQWGMSVLFLLAAGADTLSLDHRRHSRALR